MRRLWICVPFLFVAAACGGDHATITATVSDHADALTANGGDKLFEIVIDESTVAYELAELTMKITPDGGTEVPVTLELTTDADGDGKVTKGDTLTAVEPMTNIVDDTNAGDTFTVQMSREPTDGDPEELFSGNWTAG